MKILQMVPEMNAGGVERGTLEVARYLVEKGHESVVVSHGGTMVQELESAGVRHRTLAIHRKRLSSLGMVRPLRKLFQEEEPDIIHYRSRVPGWLAWLAWRKLPPAGRPHLVSSVHGLYSVNFYSAIMTRGERVEAVSESARRYILDHYPRVPPERIRVIPRGVDTRRYHPDFKPGEEWLAKWRKELPQLEGKLVVTLPGRITRLKGHEDFLQVLTHLRDRKVPVHALVVGGSHPRKQAFRREIEEKVRQSQLEEWVTFAGHRNDLAEILAVSDIVCSCSRTPESFGRTTLEALALGKAVVGYDHGGVGEQLKTCFPFGKVPPGEPLTMAGRIEAWSREPVFPVREMPYTLERMLEGTLELYEDLCSGR